MTIKFNGLEYQEDITLKELCEQLNKADGFKISAKTFNVVVESNKKELTAQEILNDVSNPSYWKATNPLKEREYYNYTHLKNRRVLK